MMSERVIYIDVSGKALADRKIPIAEAAAAAGLTAAVIIVHDVAAEISEGHLLSAAECCQEILARIRG
jgi:hypothetical protein